MMKEDGRKSMLSESVISRRAAVAGLGALVVPRHVLGGSGYQAPSDTLNIVGVGVGGMGRGYLRNFKNERIVAMCDLDPEGYAARAFRMFPQAKMYLDYREMLDNEKEVDAVVIAVPDHWHAIILMEALRRRKHIYCAKPMTHTLHELRTVLAAEREAKVVTQLSIQSCASDFACTTSEYLMSGAIGPVHEAHLWTDHPWEPAAMLRPAETPPVPNGFNWDRWLGPAPYRPYHPIYHPWNWRAWWDFGEATVGDMACHLTNIFYNALKLVPPTRVEGRRSTMRKGLFRLTPEDRDILPSKIETPETESYANMVTWDIPEREGLPPLRVHWYDGGLRPAWPLGMDLKQPLPAEQGALYVGSKGMLLTGAHGGFTLFPEKQFKDFVPPAKTLPRSIGHYREFIAAAKGSGKPTTCNFTFGGKLTELALLGGIAARTGRALDWDSKNLTFPGDSEANALIDPPKRSGYSL